MATVFMKHSVGIERNVVSVGARSETGFVRTENQDRMGWLRAPIGDVFFVSDGAGGYAGGALAASITVRVLQEQLDTLSDTSSAPERLTLALASANRSVYRHAHATPQSGLESMCATAVVLVATRTHALVAHVGDSRAYRHSRERGLEALTRDHSRVQRLIDAGQLSPDDALTHAESNVLERAIGFQPDVDAEVGVWQPVEAADTLLLCSDGLTGYVDEARIADVIAQPSNAQTLADRLVALALDAGSEDNVTVIVARGHTEAPHARRRLRLPCLPRMWRMFALSFLMYASTSLALCVDRMIGTKPERDQLDSLSSATYKNSDWDVLTIGARDTFAAHFLKSVHRSFVIIR